MTDPRPATPAELEALALVQGQHDEGPHFVFDPADMVLPRYAAVFDHYITDTPGYAGPVAVVVWSGDPSMVSVFVRQDSGHGPWRLTAQTQGEI